MRLAKLFPVIFAYPYIVALLTIADHSNGQPDEEISRVFQGGNQSYFNHLASDEQGRWVYVDAVDYLYQLSTDLKLHIKHPTPQPKSANCTRSSYNCSKEAKRAYMNENQVLVLDHLNQQLLSCSSYFSGLCRAHDTENISKIVATSSEPAVQSGPLQEMVAFVAPTLLGNSASTPGSVLHVAFLIRSHQPTEFALITTVRSTQRDRFLSKLGENTINYGVFMSTIYGFNYGNSGYILLRGFADWGLPIDSLRAGITLQAKSALVIKIDRENGNYSYSKFVLTCDDYFQKSNFSATDYTSTSMNLDKAYIYENKQETDEKVLFTLFGMYADAEDYYRKQPVGFAVCMHRLNKVHYDPIRKYDVLDGALVYSHQGRDIAPTGIAVTLVHNYTVLFMGTQTGHLHKVSVRGYDSPDADTANIYADITIDNGSAINPDILYNDKMNHIFAMTKEKIVKIKMYNCEKYNTSDECLLAKDPHCGWCSPEGRCRTQIECTDTYTNSNKWISIDGHEVPQPNLGNPSQKKISFLLIVCIFILLVFYL